MCYRVDSFHRVDFGFVKNGDFLIYFSVNDIVLFFYSVKSYDFMRFGPESSFKRG